MSGTLRTYCLNLVAVLAAGGDAHADRLRGLRREGNVVDRARRPLGDASRRSRHRGSSVLAIEDFLQAPLRSFHRRSLHREKQ